MLYNNLLFFNKKGNQSNMVWNGEYWANRIMLPQVSTDLFEIEHFFIIEQLKDNLGNLKYGYPHITPDLSATTSPIGVYCNLTEGTNEITTDNSISSDYVGAKIFTPQFPDGTLITAIDSVNGIITIADNSPVTISNVPILLNLLVANFETNVNILDFDTFNGISGSIILNNDYITSTSDLTLVSSYLSGSHHKLFIAGNGIPLDARITSISGNTIYINKKALVTLSNISIYIYPVEEKNDVSSCIYQYNLVTDPTLDAPVLNTISNFYIALDYDSSETINDNIRATSLINSTSASLNIALNYKDEGIFGRTLVIRDLSQGYPVIVARSEIHGETIGEDERFTTMLGNFGRKLNSADSFILRDSDPEEPLTDNVLLNVKRKELLLEGHEIFPYIGSYKGLINIIRFFGYQDLTIKEYWLNISKSDTTQTALQQNTAAIQALHAQGSSQTKLVSNILDDENSGKYKQVVVYGENSDGSYGIQPQLEQLMPSSTYKKTSLFGLFYNITEIVPDEFDEFGYPLTKNSFQFTPEEVLLKLFALREKLKQTYLPISAKIIDITGEGVYFGVYKQRLWVDNLKIDEIQQGTDIEITSTPSVGYIEDLRPFNIRKNKDLPYVPYVGSSPFSYSPSTYGNTVLPDITNPVLSPFDSQSLVQAIKNYYDQVNNSGMEKPYLGDDIGYTQISGSNYKVPAGFPAVLEISSFNLTWDDISNKWDGLDRNYAEYTSNISAFSDIPNYEGINSISNLVNFDYDPSTGFGTLFNIVLPSGINFLNPVYGNIQLLFQSNDNPLYQILAELETYNISNGNSEIKILWTSSVGIYSNWNAQITNIGSKRKSITYNDYSFYSNGFYAWNNLRFAGFYEIEWVVTKNDDTPFYYEFRGAISDYYSIPIILPYTGNYSVRCRVWNGSNDICSRFYPDFIKVDSRNLEIVNVSRFNEGEIYTWDNSNETWDDYIYPWVEFSEKTKTPIDVSNRIVNFSRYGNQFGEGQECKVMTTIPSILGTSSINIGLQQITVDEFTSNYNGGTGPVLVTINQDYLPHSFNNGDAVTIIDNNIGGINYSGTYDISNVTSTGFNLPFTINESKNVSLISLVKFSSITIYYQGNLYTEIYFNNSLTTTIANLTSTINKSGKQPLFGIETFSETIVNSALAQQWFSVLFHAPEGSGNQYNGKGLTIITTGGLYVYDGINTPSQSTTFYFTGGANSYEDYINFDFTGDLINPNMINYGSKSITWDSFENIQWDNLYSNSWNSYDFHHDWLGGFSIYNLQNKDLIKVGINNPGIVITDQLSPDNSLGYLDLETACNQLNSSTDPGISKFTYRVRGFSRLPDNFGDAESPIGDPLTTLAIPYEESTMSYDIQYGSPGPGAPTSIAQNIQGTLILGGYKNVNVLNDPSDITTYEISDTYPGSSPKKVKVDYKGNWWCYGEMCNVPLVIYNRFSPGTTIFISTAPLDYVSNPSCNLILKLPYTDAYSTSPLFLRQFQIICLDFNTQNENFAIYVKYQQEYIKDTPDYVFALFEYDSSFNKFVNISTNGPSWDSNKNYDNGSNCTYLGISYTSLSDDNKNNDPSSDTVNWKIIENQVYSYLDTSTYSIRQLKYEYNIKKSNLLMATDNGIKSYDGIKIKSYDTNTCGIVSNDVYSIVIDEVGGKWIGTSEGICYYDKLRWGCWTPTTNPELPVGRSRNIIDIGYGRIFFTVQIGQSTYTLLYFNGVDFKIYNNDPGESYIYSPFPEMDYDYDDTYFVLNKYKYIKNSYTAYPGDIFYIGDTVRASEGYVNTGYWNDGYVGQYYDTSGYYLRQINYFIPFIHALANNPGYNGWDFVYHITGNYSPDPINISEHGLGPDAINFDHMNGPFSTSLVSGRNPQLPYTDRNSWKIPSWINYNFDSIVYSHPSINKDDLFLDAPLRDIINGSATKESYWRNSTIPRSSQVKSGNLINDFEWVIKVGSDSTDNCVSIFVDNDECLYVTGYFTNTIVLGSKNNNTTGNISLTSNNCQSIFISKYNKAGVIQWAQMYGEDDGDTSTYDYDYYPTGIKVDYLGNIIVVGYNSKNRYDYSNDIILPNNIYLKWDWNSNFILSTTLFSVSDDSDSSVIEDLAIDTNGDLYVCGEFYGTLSADNFTLSAPDYNKVFVARIDGSGNLIYLNQLNTDGQESSVRMIINKNYQDLYLTFTYISEDSVTQNVYLSKYSSYNFTNIFNKIIKNTGFTDTTEQHISISPNGEIALGVTFTGNLLIDNYNLSSKGEFDIAVFNFNEYKINWCRSMGSLYSDYCHAVGIDSLGYIFVLGSYRGSLIASPDYTSPNYYNSPDGTSSVIMFKFNGKGDFVDIVSSGGISSAEGISICFDASDNIYLTGYVNGETSFNNWIISPDSGQDGFIAKIINERYKTGKNIGSPYSLMGSESLESSDAKITSGEFEIPLGTPVIFNPIDSFIPGKNSHHWILTDDDSGDVIIDIIDTPSFIWKFDKPGFYGLYLSVKDSNGNITEFSRSGYIRVINHNIAPPGESVKLVNSDVYRKRSIYEKGNNPQLV